MAQKKEQKGPTWNAPMSAPLAILLVVAVLLATMLADGLVSRLLFGETNPDPVAIGVSSLLVVALIVSAIHAGPDWWDTSRIPGRRLFWFFLLSLAAGLVVWVIGVGVSSLDVLANHLTIISLLVFALLIGHERRREMKRKRSATSRLPRTKARSRSKPKAPSPRSASRRASMRSKPQA